MSVKKETVQNGLFARQDDSIESLEEIMKELDELRHPKLVASPIPVTAKAQSSPMPMDRYYENGICLKPKRKHRRRIQSIHEMNANKDNNNSSYSMDSYLSNISETGEGTGNGISSLSMIKGDTNTSQLSQHVLTVDSEMNLSLLSKSSSPTVQPSISTIISAFVDDKQPTDPPSTLLPAKPTSAIPKKNNVNIEEFVPAGEEMRLGLLLSAQEASFGFNMFDTLIPSDAKDIQYLITYGQHNYVDAVLMIFERRYHTPLPKAITESIAAQLAFVSPPQKKKKKVISSNVTKKLPLQVLHTLTQPIRQYEHIRNIQSSSSSTTAAVSKPNNLTQARTMSPEKEIVLFATPRNAFFPS